MNKFHFFGKFFLNTAYTVLFSQAAILFAILIVSLRNPVANFFFATFLMSAMLIFRFYREGYGESPSERAGFIGFILGALPTWAFFGILQTLAVFAFNTQVSGNGVFSLALILSGNFKANALRVGKMPEGVAPAFALSLKRKLRDTSAGLKALESLCKYLGFQKEEDDYKEAKIITISNLDDTKI